MLNSFLIFNRHVDTYTNFYVILLFFHCYRLVCSIDLLPGSLFLYFFFFLSHRRGRWGASATGAFSTAKPKGFIDSAIHNRSAIPGSSKYRPKRVRVNQGRKFSTSFPKNDVDWAIYAARKKPGPGQYPTTKFKVNRFTDGHSGKFNQSNPANDVDIMMRRSRREPGPLEYTTSFDKVSKRLGGQQGRAFSTSVLPTFSDIQKNYTVDNPGPGHYKGDRVERNRKSSTGQISKAHVPGFVEIALRHRGSNPSPLHYQHNNYDKAIRESYGSSKMSSSFPKSDVDWKVYRASFIPGPGQYNVPHAFRSDVLHSSGANISHSISVPAVLQVPVRQTQTMSCYDGTLKVPTEIVKRKCVAISNCVLVVVDFFLVFSGFFLMFYLTFFLFSHTHFEKFFNSVV